MDQTLNRMPKMKKCPMWLYYESKPKRQEEYARSALEQEQKKIEQTGRKIDQWLEEYNKLFERQ